MVDINLSSIFRHHAKPYKDDDGYWHEPHLHKDGQGVWRDAHGRWRDSSGVWHGNSGVHHYDLMLNKAIDQKEREKEEWDKLHQDGG